MAKLNKSERMELDKRLALEAEVAELRKDKARLENTILVSYSASMDQSRALPKEYWRILRERRETKAVDPAAILATHDETLTKPLREETKRLEDLLIAEWEYEMRPSEWLLAEVAAIESRRAGK